MKQTQITDTLRNIRKQFVSWLSIIIIAMLAVIAFLGIRFPDDSFMSNMNDYYREADFRDLELFSSLLFSENDLEAINGLEEVEKAIAVRSCDAFLKKGNDSQKVTVISLSDQINVPQLKEGRYPQNDKECLIEEYTAEQLGLKTGDRIEVEADGMIRQDAFVVAGIATHPDHIAKVMDTAGSYLMVDMEVFAEEAFDGAYTALEIVFKKNKDAGYFADRYFKGISSGKEAVREISSFRETMRAAEIRDSYQKELDEKESELNEARKQLEEARKLLDEKTAEADAGKKKLDAAYRELRSGKAQLAEGKAVLDQAGGELAIVESKLNDAAAKLADARKQLTDSYREFLKYRSIIQKALSEFLPEIYGDVAWITDQSFDVDSAALSMTGFPVAEGLSIDLTSEESIAKVRSLVDAYLAAEDGDDEIKADLRKIDPSIYEVPSRWEQSHKDYLAGKEAYDSSFKEYKSQYRTFIAGLEEYEAGLAKLQEGEASYRNGVKQLAEARKQLTEKENEYVENLELYEEGQKLCEEAKRQLADLANARWVFFDVKGNASYTFARSLIQNFAGISHTFSLLFVVIGALVIYATVGKTIDEQRTQVGTTKALGFFNLEIMGKYLSFGVSATAIGSLLGVAAAYFGVSGAVLESTTDYFRIGEGELIMEWPIVALVVAFSILLAIAAVYLACIRMVRSPARILMQDAMPRAVKKKGKSAAEGSLYPKLILRNMVNDPKRVLVTIISVAGSCALIVIGLTVMHSISSATDIQFNEIYRYDYLLDYDSSVNENVEAEVEKILRDNDAEFIRVSNKARAFMNGEELDSADILCGDLEEIADYLLVPEVDSEKELRLSDQGIYIPQKLEESGHFARNGSITMYDDAMNSYDVPVAEPFACYVARFFIMSSDLYRECFHEDPSYNQYLIRIDDRKGSQIKESLERIGGVSKYYHSDERKTDFISFISIARAMVGLLTAMSFMMAYCMLLNLVNRFINQKKRELTIMRINGFTVKEVKIYVGSEMVATTVAGILLGLPLGSFMAYRIILLLENINVFDRRIYWPGWLLAALTTAAFSFIISRQALKKVKDLKLTDIA